MVKRYPHNQSGSHSGNVGVKQVGSHARDITDVIADIIGNNGRIARIVFRQAERHFADEVGTDIRRLRKNTAARLGKQRHGAGAEAETQHG